MEGIKILSTLSMRIYLVRTTVFLETLFANMYVVILNPFKQNFTRLAPKPVVTIFVQISPNEQAIN